MSFTGIGHSKGLLIKRRKVALSKKIRELSFNILIDAVCNFCEILSAVIRSLRYQVKSRAFYLLIEQIKT